MIKNPYSQWERINLLAYECINGTFGDGRKREKALGNMYSMVQARVNQIYREQNRVHAMYDEYNKKKKGWLK